MPRGDISKYTSKRRHRAEFLAANAEQDGAKQGGGGLQVTLGGIAPAPTPIDRKLKIVGPGRAPTAAGDKETASRGYVPGVLSEAAK